MLNNIKYIVDIGSSSVRLIAVTKFASQTCIVAEEEELYDGFMDGEFLTPSKLDAVFSSLFSKLTEKIRKPIKTVYVGVPAEFSKCVCKRISRKFVDIHKITNLDIKDLYENNMDFNDSQNYAVINYSPMQYVLDDQVKTLSPVNKKSTSLVLDASFILAKKSFIDLITAKLTGLGAEDVEFVSAPLGQAMNCDKDNKKPKVVVDVGHITSSVAVFKGEGLALLSSFSMGGGHISSDLMQVLGLSFKDAELIKRKIILTIDDTKNENYEVCYKGNLIKAPINLTNQIVKSRIEIIAKIVDEILSIDEVFKGLDVYLTGDGISNFKGVKNIFKDVANLDVKEYKNQFDNSKNKYQTSITGLASLVQIVE